MAPPHRLPASSPLTGKGLDFCPLLLRANVELSSGVLQRPKNHNLTPDPSNRPSYLSPFSQILVSDPFGFQIQIRCSSIAAVCILLGFYVKVQITALVLGGGGPAPRHARHGDPTRCRTLLHPVSMAEV